MLLNATSYARAGLIGNPSDGYFGKTLSCAFENYSATVVLYETPELQFLPGDVDDAVFTDLDHLVREVRLFGYYGGIRLLKAVTKLFVDHCREHGITLPRRNFTARYTSTIPRLVGLSGSSAIVGTWADDAQYDRLTEAMAAIGCTTFKPIIGRGQWRPANVLK